MLHYEWKLDSYAKAVLLTLCTVTREAWAHFIYDEIGKDNSDNFQHVTLSSAFLCIINGAFILDANHQQQNFIFHNKQIIIIN